MNRIRRALARPLRTAVCILALITLGFVLTPNANAAASYRYWQLDSDYCYDAVTLDSDYNGYWNTIWHDVDNDCRWDTALWNTTGSDALLERMSFDMNENGSVEVLLVDTNQRVGFEWVYKDLNQNGVWDHSEYREVAVVGPPTYSGAQNLAITYARLTGNVLY